VADSDARSKLITEIAELKKRQLESYRRATFGGWSPEEQAAHDLRAERLTALMLKLDALNRSLTVSNNDHPFTQPRE
jgi:hypothetical protein